MTNTKQEELKKLLVSADFKEESYQQLSVQDVIILKKSAAAMKEKNVAVPQAAMLFTKREEFFWHLILRRLQKMEQLWVLFAKCTNLPYVVCDPESCNDQIQIFSEESFAKKSAMQELQNKRELMVVKLENKQFLGFYMSLYSMGVNELVLDKGANTIEIELEKLVKKPYYSALAAEKRPVVNPELMLTAIYFAQERVLPEEQRNMEQLRELEEEMLVNLGRGKVLLPVLVPEGQEQVQLKDMKIPYLKMQNGDAYQPVCSDPTEFQKFNREQKLRAIAVESGKLKGLINGEAKGILLNPGSVRLAIPKGKL